MKRKLMKNTESKNSSENILDVKSEILALKLVLTPVIGAILDAPAVVKKYEYLLARAEEERRAVDSGWSSVDAMTLKALFSAEAWLKEMCSDYLEEKLKAETRPAGGRLS